MLTLRGFAIAVPLLLLGLGTSHASAQYDFYQHHLLASCSLAPPDRGVPVTTANGVGMTHRAGVGLDVVMYCPIDSGDASPTFNWLKVNAEDNTPNGYVTATLYRQQAGFYVFTPPEVIASVTTTDMPGVQEAGTSPSDEFYLMPLDDMSYVYWIEVRIHRTSTSANLIAYVVSLMDVL